MDDDKRQSSRHRTLKGGSIIFGFAAGIDCTIRNLTKNGACLIVESQIGVPNQFSLLIKPENIKRDCHVAWRLADKIGVRFV